MRLTKLCYVENVDTPQEWRLNAMTFDPINLIVGRNASGKSRTLSVLWNLVARISGLIKEPLNTGDFALEFMNDQHQIKYEVSIIASKVQIEKYYVDDVIRLNRTAGGRGVIFAEKENKDLDFQSPEDQLAVVIRQDSLQHTFLEPLINWASGVFFLQFGTPLGRDNFVMIQEGGPEVNPRDANQAVGIFRRADKDFPSIFKDRVINDMSRIGYYLDDVGVSFTETVKIINFPQRLSSLYVKEKELSSNVEQLLISQGMFRALSTIIQINYGILSGASKCILIDDIGEGLDYSRSCDLIELIVERIEGSNLQLIASTNDRFVMNSVNLKYWTILDRKKSVVQPLNYRNSKDVFDEFKFTGLSNFDFLSRDFFREAVK